MGWKEVEEILEEIRRRTKIGRASCRERVLDRV